MPDAEVVTLRERAARYSPAQRRTIDVALQLFAAHGVGGTSLQMIADDVGVTKAAIYHQFSTKEAIVLGVIDVKLQPLEDAIEAAESAALTRAAREAVLVRVVDTVVANRRALGPLQNDPVLFRLLGEHEPSRRLWVRLFSELLGDDRGAQARVRAAVLSAAIGAAAHPFVEDLEDDTLRHELLQITHALVFGD
ncbi:MAG: TetR/AcrR family transcriptional regulator [Acidimicrobiales bacterium]